MQYAVDFDLPVSEEITLNELLIELENEVTAVASIDGRYLEAWHHLTPATALDFLNRRRYDIVERCRWSVDDVLKFFDERKLTTALRSHHESQALVGYEQEAAEWSTDVKASYDRMLSLALNARYMKPERPAGMSDWTNETWKAIEQIRASEYAERTVFLLSDTQLPSSLQTAMHRRHTAVRVSDAWMDEYMSYVTHDAPSLAVVHRPHAAPVLVLEIASGTIRLDATRLVDHLREFDTELPVLFVTSDGCCLSVHRFNSLVDGAIIGDFVRRPESHALLPQRDEFARLRDGSTMAAEERFSVFEAWSTERPLTGDSDELEDIPF